MERVAMLFLVLLLAGIGIFGLSVKAMMLAVVKPLGGKIRKVSTISFGVVTLLLGVATAGVSLGIVFPSLGGVAYWLVLAFLCTVSAAIQVKLALAEKPEEPASTDETAATPEPGTEAPSSAPGARVEPTASTAPGAAMAAVAVAAIAGGAAVAAVLEAPVESETVVSEPVVIQPVEVPDLVAQQVEARERADFYARTEAHARETSERADALARAEASERADALARTEALVHLPDDFGHQ